MADLNNYGCASTRNYEPGSGWKYSLDSDRYLESLSTHKRIQEPNMRLIINHLVLKLNLRSTCT